MKLQNIINKQTELIYDNKEFWEKLMISDSNFDEIKKENEVLKSKVSHLRKKPCWLFQRITKILMRM